jgi:hypothetical protein
MISTPVETSEMYEKSSGGISSFDKRPGVRVSGDDRLHWRMKKMDYPVCLSIYLSHDHSPPYNPYIHHHLPLSY